MQQLLHEGDYLSRQELGIWQLVVCCSIDAAEIVGKPFPNRKLSSLPEVAVDSTIYLSEERDAR
jgi:hypothetical protein